MGGGVVIVIGMEVVKFHDSYLPITNIFDKIYTCYLAMVRELNLAFPYLFCQKT